MFQFNNLNKYTKLNVKYIFNIANRYLPFKLKY